MFYAKKGRISNRPVKAVRPAWAALARSLDHSTQTQSRAFQLSLSENFISEEETPRDATKQVGLLRSSFTFCVDAARGLALVFLHTEAV